MTKKYLYLLAAGHLSVDINSGSLPAVLPFLVAEHGLDYTSVAGLMFAGSFLSSVIQPLIGYLADKKSCQWVMPLGIAMAGLSLSAAGFVGDYWLIFALVTMMGIGSAIFHPEAARLVNAVSGRKKGRGMSIFSVGGNGGFGLGPILAVALISFFGLQGLAFYGVLSLCLAGTFLFFLPRLRAAAGENGVPLPPAAGSGGPASLGASLPRNDWSAFLRLTLVILFRSTTQSAVSAFLPLFCIRALGASAAVGSATLSVIALAGIVATLLGGRLADRYGYVRVLRTGCWLMVPVLAVMAFSGSLWGVGLMLVPFALTLQGTYAAFVVLGQSYLARSVGFASGITLGLSFSLGGLMVPALGMYADSYGIASVMELIVGITLVCAISSLFLPPVRQKN